MQITENIFDKNNKLNSLPKMSPNISDSNNSLENESYCRQTTSPTQIPPQQQQLNEINNVKNVQSYITQNITQSQTNISNNFNSESQNSSPISRKSEKITIVSLKDSDSSSLCSNSDIEYEDEESPPTSKSYYDNSLMNNCEFSPQLSTNPATIIQRIPNQNSSEATKIGNLISNNSTIDIGTKNIYNDSVTIYQIINDKKASELRPSTEGSLSQTFPYEDNQNIDIADSKNKNIPAEENIKQHPKWPLIQLLKKNSHTILFLSGFLIILLVIVKISITLSELKTEQTPLQLHQPIKPSDGIYLRKSIQLNFTDDYSNMTQLQYVSRAAWVAQPPSEELRNLKLPVNRIIIAHTVTEKCLTIAQCVNRMQSIQKTHLQRKWDDIGYNFLVGGDGNVYEGRGWHKEGAHTYAEGNINPHHKWPPVQLLKKKPLTIMLLSGFFVIILVIVGMSIRLSELKSEDKPTQQSLKPGDGDDSRKNIPIISTIAKSLPNTAPLRYVTRDEWVAQPPSDVLNDLSLPVNRVIIAHTATEKCETQAQCVFRVRYIQQFHMESRNWDDIGYNFLVGGDGAVYEGRGWYKEGAHTKGFNKGSICIAFIGTFNKVEPEKRQIRAAELIIEEGLREGHITKDYNIFGHRSFYATESPGDVLFNIIKTWPHFNETVGYDI